MSCGGCGKVVKGAVGIAKALAGVDRAKTATIEARRVICRQCPEAIPCTRKPEKKCTCRACGCVLTFKTMVKGEVCPLGKW